MDTLTQDQDLARSPNPNYPNRIAELRKARRISLRALARSCECSVGQLSKLENSQIQLTQDWLYRLAEVLKVEPFELLPESSDPARILPMLHKLLALLPAESRAEALDQLGSAGAAEDLPIASIVKGAGATDRLIEVTVRDDGSYHAVVFYRPKKGILPEEPPPKPKGK
jgi:transcriptional regulator with XRE-family HTH domain